MSDSSRSVLVNLLNREYRVACPPGERDNLIQAAHLLDEKLHKVEAAGIVGLERIAIMTALNLAHELLQSKTPNGNVDALLEKINAELAAGKNS
ncbi:MAG TPA: cell division protein ZapA [Alcanivoracaceae bacterium]|nr:cell division protein ZapA [Alcanivoracaceae bacterium]